MARTLSLQAGAVKPSGTLGACRHARTVVAGAAERRKIDIGTLRLSRIGKANMVALEAVAHATKTDTAADFDAIVIGAGVSGLYQLYKLREIGLRVRVFES